MEVFNLNALRNRNNFFFFYSIPYTNVKDLDKAYGFNMTVIWKKRYG